VRVISIYSVQFKQTNWTSACTKVELCKSEDVISNVGLLIGWTPSIVWDINCFNFFAYIKRAESVLQVGDLECLLSSE
jgi:hypothetical protein